MNGVWESPIIQKHLALQSPILKKHLLGETEPIVHHPSSPWIELTDTDPSIGGFAAQFGVGLVSEALLGVPLWAAGEERRKALESRATVERIGRGLGTVTGFAVGLPAKVAAKGGQLALRAGTKLLPRAGRVAQAAMRGAGAMTALSALQAPRPGETIPERFRQIGISTGLGAATGGVLAKLTRPRPFMPTSPLEIARQRQLVEIRQIIRDKEYIGSLKRTKFPEPTWGVLEQVERTLPKKMRLGPTPMRQLEENAQAIRHLVNIDTMTQADLSMADPITAATMLRAVRINLTEKALDASQAGINSEAMQTLYRWAPKVNALSYGWGLMGNVLKMPYAINEVEAARQVTETLLKAGAVSPQKAMKVIKQISQPTFWDKLVEIRGSALLTSPLTIERASTGNAIGRIFRTPERILAGTWNRVESFLTGQPRERFATEGMADIFGTTKAIPQAFRGGWNALLHEEYITQSRMAEAMTRRGFAISGRLGTFARLGYRGVTAVDEFWHTLSKQASLYTQAYRQALTEKAKNIPARVSELIKNPTIEMADQATKDALLETMRLGLGSTGRAFTRWLNKQGNPAKIIMPFMRTPVNLYKWAFRRSPFGVFSPKNWADILSENPGLRAEGIGRIAMGQLFNVFIAQQAFMGNVTGQLSSNWRERQSYMREGIQPYAVKIGDKYINYMSFQPAGMQMAAIANIVEQIKEGKAEPTSEQLMKIATKTVTAMRNQSFLMGVRDLSAALADPERRGQRFIQNLVTGVATPPGISYLKRLTDPTYRIYDTIPEAIRARIPGLSKIIVPRRDIYGKEIKMEMPIWQRMISPTRITKYKPSIREQELRRLEVYPEPIRKKLKGIPLTPEERDIIARAEGPLIDYYTNLIITNPAFARLNDLAKTSVMRNVISRVRSTIRDPFFNKKIASDYKSLKSEEARRRYIEDLVNNKALSMRMRVYFTTFLQERQEIR